MILGGTLIGMIVVLFATSGSIVGGSYTELEEEDARLNVQRVLGALGHELEDLKSKLAYHTSIVDSGSTGPVRPDPEGVFELGVDLLAYIDLSGRFVAGYATDPTTGVASPPTADLVESLMSISITRYSGNYASAEGWTDSPAGPLLIASMPVPMKGMAGPVGGTLVLGNYLDDGMLGRLGGLAHVALDLRRVDDPAFSEDFPQAGAPRSTGQPIVVKRLSSETVAGYAVVDDVAGEPFLSLRVDIPRTIRRQGEISLVYFLLSLVALGVVVGTAILLLLEKFVLSRLGRLGTEVRDIGETGDLSRRVTVAGGDELTELAIDVNDMLSELEVEQTQRAHAQLELKVIHDDLEERVAERTNELVLANESLHGEVDERRRVEAALASRAGDLVRSNTDLEHFAYAASHDLQEPLRAVAGFSSMLSKRSMERLDDEDQRLISRVVGAAARMQDLLNDLLSYSRIARDVSTFAPVDSEALIHRELENLRVAIEETGAVVTWDPLPTLTANAALLGQVFGNLIGNAVKYHRDETPRIHASAERTDGEWVFSVSDNGIGIDPQYADRIFVIFQRLHSRTEYEGTGIGLAIAKRAVESLGGRIWVESELGTGSTFYFTVPSTKVRTAESDGEAPIAMTDAVPAGRD